MHLRVRVAHIGCVLLAGAAAGAAAPSDVHRPPWQWAGQRHRGVAVASLSGNRVACRITEDGELCGDPPIRGGGFWPGGTLDQYIFNSGLQIAGVVSPAAGFAWAGDTTGAFFFDLRGTQVHATALTGVFDSRNRAHRKAWPAGAVALDGAVFEPSLLGDTVVSEHDLWTRYWDGDPRRLNGRTHPMGILVEQRALAWSYPTGNEDIAYFALALTNVTARDPAAYAGAPAAMRAEIAAVGALFQDSNEAVLGVAIPDGGYALTDVYLAITMDADVGDVDDYATAVLPFNLGMTYDDDFREPAWQYPPDLFTTPPFVPAPGFVGVTFPRAPADLALFTTYTGSSTGFPSPVGVRQLWRYLSGTTSAGDNPCTFATPVQRPLCFLNQSAIDQRFTTSYGPFTLAPGETKTVVVAYLFAAPLDTVQPYIGVPGPSQLKPGVPFGGDSIALDTTRIRAIERAAGWRTQSDVDGDGVIEAHEVATVPRSLLHKAQVAQALVDAKFLLPQPPAAPDFAVIPQDDAVTITWQPSATEAVGDLYAAFATDPASPLYDSNFRRFDVEGYRVYRGTTPDRLELVAQFDYTGTTMRDYTGAFAYPGRCAPELGVGADCPVAFGPTPDPAVYVEHALAGRVAQVPLGGRALLSSGDVLLVRADTTAELRDSGVPFSFTDRGVRNGFPYYYAVTAFDVNSRRSAPGSTESAPNPKLVMPRRAAATASLDRVHTVPDPLYVRSGFEQGGPDPLLWFVNLPAQAIIRIYSTSGILVAVVVHNDPSGGGEAAWNLRSRTGRRVASGPYFYHVEEPGGLRTIGRFTVVTR